LTFAFQIENSDLFCLEFFAAVAAIGCQRLLHISLWRRSALTERRYRSAEWRWLPAQPSNWKSDLEGKRCLWSAAACCRFGCLHYPQAGVTVNLEVHYSTVRAAHLLRLRRQQPGGVQSGSKHPHSKLPTLFQKSPRNSTFRREATAGLQIRKVGYKMVTGSIETCQDFCVCKGWRVASALRRSYIKRAQERPLHLEAGIVGHG